MLIPKKDNPKMFQIIRLLDFDRFLQRLLPLQSPSVLKKIYMITS